MYRATWELEGPNRQLGGRVVVHLYLCMLSSMLCMYVSMVCQRCMLYDDVDSHDSCHDHTDYVVEYSVLVEAIPYVGL